MPVERYTEGGIRLGLMDDVPRYTLPNTSDLPGYGATDATIINMVKANQILRDENRDLRSWLFKTERRINEVFDENNRLKKDNRRLKALKYKPGKKPKKKAKKYG